MKKLVSIVVPVYNEQDNVALLNQTIQRIFEPLPYRFNIFFVDDGSSDGTLENLKKLSLLYDNVRFLSFSRNFGHQAALKAGLDMADGDCVISMDGDMQHPPKLIPLLLEKWEEGLEVVYTIRKEDRAQPFMKRKTSNLFYAIMSRLSDIEIEKGTADFRLLDRKVVDVLSSMQEYDLFFRGLVKWAGFRQLGIEYVPEQRNAGVSKYTYRKMLRFALQGFTSFSTRPLYAATYLGFIFAMLSSLYIPYAVFSLVFDHPISGWASIIVTIAFFGGLQLMILGIIGVYLGKLFTQSKQRPVYLVRESNLTKGNSRYKGGYLIEDGELVKERYIFKDNNLIKESNLVKEGI
ncbi:glycosyltransferase family 2 protein [Chitinophaga nivalis]|uniref:Glycosyltransferase family 2 protein n=1 Tax=Chitinophaga nivalis TaxID=2991709 RepID=A0ABT3IEY1_9BACT|nr:glycosyltransferase family 2 protein [Chitinophaga nivalis]MCW3467798.1 glycosyltransferase family 2 protein [Chitinophaga nivalis]MCW3482510.1 glycosyltransferase family 2 protein [Chitinophaga nivalis]